MHAGPERPAGERAIPQHRALLVGADDHERAQGEEHGPGEDGQRRHRPAEHLIEPAPRHFDAELIVDQFAHHLSERLGRREQAEEPAVERRPRNLARPLGAVGGQERREQNLAADEDHHPGHEPGEPFEERRLLDDRHRGRPGKEERGHEERAHQIARAAAEQLPLPHPRVAADPAGGDEGHEGHTRGREHQADGIAVFGEREGDLVGAEAGGSVEHRGPRGDQINGHCEAHGRQAVGIEPVEPVTGELQFVARLAEDRGARRILRGELLGGERFSPFDAVLLIDDREDDPDRDATGDVPGGGLDRGTLRPGPDQSRGHAEHDLDGEPGKGGRGRPAVCQFVAIHGFDPAIPIMQPRMRFR